MQLVKPKGITIFGALWCPYCKRVKKHLDAEKIKYSWVDVDDHEDEYDEVKEKLKYRTIPVIFFDGKFKKGCDEFFAELKENKAYLDAQK